MFKVTGAKTLNAAFNSLFGKVGIALQYALTQSGPMSMAPSQFGMFTKSDPSKATPDLEYHVQPLSTDRLGDPLHPFPAITVSVCNLRPDSVGSVHARRPIRLPSRISGSTIFRPPQTATSRSRRCGRRGRS